MSTTTTTHQLELVYVPPGSLLVDRNIRLGLDITDEFVESLRDHGVLQPIVAVMTAHGGLDGDGALRVRFGNRRAIGAITAGLAEVPVLVAGDEATDDPGEIDRILTQLAENDDRAALTTLDHISAIEQLALLGLDELEIAQRTRRDVDAVSAALTVGKSQLASDLALAVPDLDLERLAVLAEFDDDPETANELAVEGRTASSGGWDHLVSRKRRDRNAKRREQLALVKLVELVGDDVKVIPRPNYGDAARSLTQLAPADGPLRDLTPEEHQGCPGYAVYLRLESDRWNFTKGEPARPAGLVVLPPDEQAPEADDAEVEELDECSVCGCTEDDACEVFNPEDKFDPDPEPCSWTGVVDPKNPTGRVCSACADADGNVIEERRSVAAGRPIEDVNLPGDAPAKPDRVEYATWYEVGYACTTPSLNGHRDRYASTPGSSARVKADQLRPAEREKAKAERKDVIDSNKAWKAATPVRRAWVKKFLADAKELPASAGVFLTDVLTGRSELDRNMRGGRKLAAELLGIKAKEDAYYGDPDALPNAAKKASEGRARIIALGYVMACCEDQTETNTWRRRLDYEQAYFRFLADLGYELADVEKRVIPGYKPKNPPKTAKPAAKAPAKPRAPRKPAAKKTPDPAAATS
jgi:ParB/RepB/Spo0J family partition protein